MLLFKKKFLPAIRCREKTQTIRLWNVCRMKAGQRSYIPGAGYIRVTAVTPVDVASLTDADALQKELQTLYAEQLQAGYRAYRITFEMLSDEEQAAAVAARQADKAKLATR